MVCILQGRVSLSLSLKRLLTDTGANTVDNQAHDGFTHLQRRDHAQRYRRAGVLGGIGIRDDDKASTQGVSHA